MTIERLKEYAEKYKTKVQAFVDELMNLDLVFIASKGGDLDDVELAVLRSNLEKIAEGFKEVSVVDGFVKFCENRSSCQRMNE